MEKNNAPTDLIVSTIKEKSLLKQKVYDQTVKVFQELKKILKEKVHEVNNRLGKVDKRVLMQYSDKGDFEAEIKLAGDLIIFNMHSNIFEFDREHGIWKISYVQKDHATSFCGIINIYNFLADSFKYNRMDDLGYCIGRIFINKDKHFFVEGKRQLGFLYNNFGNKSLDSKSLTDIVESAMLFSLDFDLLVPPFENISVATVAQMHKKFEQSKIKTGKRLGFQFYKDNDT